MTEWRYFIEKVYGLRLKVYGGAIFYEDSGQWILRLLGLEGKWIRVGVLEIENISDFNAWRAC